MRRNQFNSILFGSVLIISGGFGTVGCHKSDSQTSSQSATPASVPGGNQGAQGSGSQNPTPAGLQGDDKAALVAAQAAMKTKDYKSAASLMIQLTAPPKQPRTQAEAAMIANQMRSFQQNLAGAAASGDPAAIAAAQQLRAANMH